MNTQKQIRKIAGFKDIKLGGVEIVNSLEGSGGTDFFSLTIKDTKTNTLITFSRGQYSDMIVHATHPVKTEIRYVLINEQEDGEFRSKPFKLEELEAAKEAHPGCSVNEVECVVEE